MPRKKKPAAQEFGGLPLVLGDPNASVEPAHEPTQKEPWEEKLEALSKGFEEREKKYNDQIDRLFGMLTNVASAAPTYTSQVQSAVGAQTPTLDLSNLPDPIADSPGYNRQLADRLQKFTIDTAAYNRAQMVAQTGVSDQAAATQRRLDMLWDKFQGAHPEFKGMEDIVQIAAQGIVKDHVDMGGDANRLMFANPDGFVEKVAVATKTRLEKIGWRPNADDDDDDGNGDDPADNSRTALPSGQPASTARGSVVTTQNPRMAGLLGELSRWQREAKLV